MTIKDIEKAVTRLPAKKLASFRAWFYKFENRMWDKQFNQDVKSGKFDRVAEEAARDYKSGRCREL